MKHYRIHAAVFAAALSAFVVVAALVARAAGEGQTQQTGQAVSAAPSGFQPTVATRERRATEPAAAPSDAAAPSESSAPEFASAATRNTDLRYDLSWAFGGKQQRGWHLYTPLITRLIETEAGEATGGFASALARWQKSAGLAPSGVLDDETLYKMVSAWQGARLKDKSEPRPEQLLLAPASDFWDPSRPEELRRVERETYAAYKRMVAAAAADPSLNLRRTADGGLAGEERFLKIVSSFRSREYQEKLRRESPHSGRAGLAKHSPHFTGRALDIYVGGEPVETKDSNRALQVKTPVYRWLVRNAERFGFRPYYYEPWHWEYVGAATAGK